MILKLSLLESMTQSVLNAINKFENYPNIIMIKTKVTQTKNKSNTNESDGYFSFHSEKFNDISDKRKT